MDGKRILTALLVALLLGMSLPVTGVCGEPDEPKARPTVVDLTLWSR